METYDLCTCAQWREREERRKETFCCTLSWEERAGGIGVLLLHAYAQERAEGAEGTGSASCTIRVRCHAH